MRRFCFALTLLAFAATCRAEDEADQPVLVLQTGGHTAPIVKVLFTPDGQQVVTVSEDHTIRLWDSNTGERLGVFRLPMMGDRQGAPRSGALSPDGKTLAVGGDPYQVDGKPAVKVWLIDLAAGAVVGVPPGGEAAVHALAFSHDGKLLAGGDQGGKVLLWNVAERKWVNTLEGHTGPVWDVAFSPNDALLASGSEDRSVRLWDVAAGKEARTVKKTGVVHCLAWQDDKTLFAAGEGENTIHEWSLDGEGKRDYDARPKGDMISALSFFPDKNELFYLWSERAKGDAPNLRHNGGAVLDLKTAASRDGLTWASHVDAIHGAVSTDGLLAAASGDDNRGVSLWTLKDGALATRLEGVGETPFFAGWSPDGASVGWSSTRTVDPDAAPLKRPGLRRKAGTSKPDKTLQRSFDLTELAFGKKPNADYVRFAHELGGVRLGGRQSGGGAETFHLVTTTKPKTALGSIHAKGSPLSFTLLSGERAAVGGDGWIDIYNARGAERIRQLQCPAGVVWDLAPSPDGRYLLAAFSDQTLRVYDPEKEDPLLSLFVAGSDRIAWTNDGYYAASPGGEKLMGWQVNHGLDELGAFYPAEQFHKAFYRPDIICRVLAEGSVEKARAAADKDSGQTTQAVNVAQALPPEVKLLAPAAGKQDKAVVEVKAEAGSKDRPIVTMHLLMDGRPCPGADAASFPDAKPGDRQTATWKVTLPDGEHHLVALAETDASLGASPEVVVAWQSAAQEPLPNLYVLAIGVNKYPGSLKLDWAVKDAADVAGAFQGGGAPKPFGKVDPKLLLDEAASREGILAGLDWLKAKMTADDTAVVFYAGHGHRDRKTSQFYMPPFDVNPAALAATGVTGTEIKDKLRVVPGKVLVLLDACHSGSIGQAPLDPNTDDVQRQLAAPDCGVVVMCAAMAQEEAGEAATVQHGFFTAALLQGLGGEAPTDKKDGLIHLTGLDFYVEQAVAELSNEEQHVVVDRPSTVTSFPLVKPPAKAEGK